MPKPLIVESLEETITRRYSYDRARGLLISKQSGAPVQYKHGDYLYIDLFRRHVRVHHIIWWIENGAWPIHSIDHIDGNPLNNRIENLRAANASQNNANSVVRSDNKLGLKGVRAVKKNTVRYRAVIRVNRRQIHIGYFSSAKEAHDAYCAAARRYHGEFACSGMRASGAGNTQLTSPGPSIAACAAGSAPR